MYNVVEKIDTNIKILSSQHFVTAFLTNPIPNQS